MIKNIQFNTIHALKIEDAEIKTSNKKRILLVDTEISASAKPINGRIYAPAGHKNGLRSWVYPKSKPVIKYHNDNSDPIGRVTSVEWVDNENNALSYLGGDVKALADMKRAYASNDPLAINKAMARYGGYSPGWPGLGRVLGKLKIVDQDAIDKFIDERYMFFSAGQSTDAFVCLTCGAKWHMGDHCDHPFNGKDEEGNPVFYLCGNMKGTEYSVVNNPANDTSYVIGMQLQDRVDDSYSIVINDNDTSVPEINFISAEKSMDLKDLQQLETKSLVNLLTSDDEKLKEFTDALAGDTQYEISWLIRIHDSLHSMYDYTLKYEPENATIPIAVYKLHGTLHDIAVTKDFRDSFQNGILDKYSMNGAATDEYVYESTDVVAPTLDIAVIRDSLEKMFNERLDVIAQRIIDETKKEVKENKEDVLVDELDEPLTDDTIDWELLDIALESLVGDAKLSTEKRAALGDKSFCGPNRSFPVADCDHVTAARKLIGRAKLSADQKKAVLACVDRKAKKLGCDAKKDEAQPVLTDDKKLTEMTADYAQALKTIEELSTRMTALISKVADKQGKKTEISDLKLDGLFDWLDNNIHPPVVLKPIDTDKVNLPDVLEDRHKETDTISGTQLDAFGQEIVLRYKRKVEKEGKVSADRYLSVQKQYLPKDFNIEEFIKDKE